MNARDPILLAVVLFVAARALGDQAWAYVPSSLDTRRLEAIAVPNVPTEAAVTLVGTRAESREPADEPERVFAVDIFRRTAFEQADGSADDRKIDLPAVHMARER